MSQLPLFLPLRTSSPNSSSTPNPRTIPQTDHHRHHSTCPDHPGSNLPAAVGPAGTASAVVGSPAEGSPGEEGRRIRPAAGRGSVSLRSSLRCHPEGSGSSRRGLRLDGRVEGTWDSLAERPGVRPVMGVSRWIVGVGMGGVEGVASRVDSGHGIGRAARRLRWGKCADRRLEDLRISVPWRARIEVRERVVVERRTDGR